ncbi:MAG: 2-hydroxyacid dehydrogenase [Alphaproteobacteria bacterium]|jgi:lactate dehydrogenase-like 2-hydroxyacid dehydrogenase|nr:2-hydroxyacid dehydrogenase [Alphaproteobacteria bacterium]
MSADQPVVLQVTDFPAVTNERLEATFDVLKYHEAADGVAFIAEVRDRVRGMAITTPGDPADRAMIESLPNLEIIAANAVGVDFIDRAAAAERGVIVTNTPGVLTDCVADHGMGLLLAVSRGIVEGDRYVRAGRWPREGDMHLTAGLKGKTVGIVGLGRIGKEVAKRARAFGMEIAYHGRAAQSDVTYRYYGAVADLAEAADYLVLCCPGGDETRHLVNAEVLSALGPKGFLVNIARGSVVDEAALIEAAAERRIAGAAIDVFEDEPNVPEALLPLDNVVVQPHQASATVETRTAMGDLMIDNLLRHFAGEPVLTPVG